MTRAPRDDATQPLRSAVQPAPAHAARASKPGSGNHGCCSPQATRMWWLVSEEPPCPGGLSHSLSLTTRRGLVGAASKPLDRSSRDPVLARTQVNDRSLPRLIAARIVAGCTPERSRGLGWSQELQWFVQHLDRRVPAGPHPRLHFRSASAGPSKYPDSLSNNDIQRAKTNQIRARTGRMLRIVTRHGSSKPAALSHRQPTSRRRVAAHLS